MKNFHIVQKPHTDFVRKALRVVAIVGVALLAIGAFEYARWVRGTVPESHGNGPEEVMGLQTCQPITDTEFLEKIEINRSWFLLGDEFSDTDSKLKVTASVDTGTIANIEDLVLEYEIQNTEMNGSFVRPESGSEYTAVIDTRELEARTHTLVVNAENSCSEMASSQTIPFTVSYPVYVVWSIDWEGSDVKQQYLNDMNTIADVYGVPMTHFFNPRIYLPSVVSSDRAAYLTEYVLEGKESRGDAIGLHLHMFPDMVSAAGVTPQYSPAWGWSRTDGYDILVSGYSYDKMDAVLDWSKNIFEENGLELPVMFRAGGWFADEGTLLVLEDNGFTTDSSGRTAYTLGTNNVATHWSLSETTQPFHPSYTNQNIAGAPGMDLWEFPNNGGDSWAFSKDEMYARYRMNYAGGASSERKVVTYLSHPDWFDTDKPKMEALFADIGNDLYVSDKGPVIYTTLEDLYRIVEK